MQPKATPTAFDVAQLHAEDHIVGVAGGVKQHRVGQLVVVVEMAQHAHDRRDAAPRADEQELRWRIVGQHEVAFNAAERDDRPRPPAPHEVGGHLAIVDALHGDADQPVLAVRIRRQRVGAPVPHARDVEPDPQVLPGLVPRPAVAGLDQHRGGVLGLVVDLLDPPTQLASRPQRIDQLQVVVREQRTAQRAECLQDSSLDRVDVWGGAFFRHLMKRDSDHELFLLKSNIHLARFITWSWNDTQARKPRLCRRSRAGAAPEGCRARRESN